jgi:hypothetical protein
MSFKGGEAMTQETSIKQLIQGMQVKDLDIVEGEVISAAPLKIKLVNNEKMILDKDIMVIPRHLTDYSASVDITLPAEAILTSVTKTAGDHFHSAPGGSTSTDGNHTHTLDTFSIQGAQMTVHNSLKKGERVYILSFNRGKQYYIMDRVMQNAS